MRAAPLKLRESALEVDIDEAADTQALTLALQTLTTFNLDEKVDEVLGIAKNIFYIEVVLGNYRRIPYRSPNSE